MSCGHGRFRLAAGLRAQTEIHLQQRIPFPFPLLPSPPPSVSCSKWIRPRARLVFIPLRGIRGRHAHHIPRSSHKSSGPEVGVVQRRDGVVPRRREEVGPRRARGIRHLRSSGLRLDIRCNTEKEYDSTALKDLIHEVTVLKVTCSNNRHVLQCSGTSIKGTLHAAGKMSLGGGNE